MSIPRSRCLQEAVAGPHFSRRVEGKVETKDCGREEVVAVTVGGAKRRSKGDAGGATRER